MKSLENKQILVTIFIDLSYPKFYDGVWRNEVLFRCVAGAGDTFFSKKWGMKHLLYRMKHLL